MATSAFPGNSKKQQEQPTPKEPKREPPKKVVTGEVIQKKPGLGHRFKAIFLGADFRGATAYVLGDVLVPAVRDMMVDATTRGVQRVVYGEHIPQSRRPSGRGHTTYNRPSPRGRSYMLPDQPPRHAIEANSREHSANRDVILSSKEEAQEVLEGMNLIIDQHEVATVSDYHHLLGLPSTFVDQNWGWFNLAHVDIRQTREGFAILMPAAEPIN